jgi:hypothetical protein
MLVARFDLKAWIASLAKIDGFRYLLMMVNICIDNLKTIENKVKEDKTFYQQKDIENLDFFMSLVLIIQNEIISILRQEADREEKADELANLEKTTQEEELRKKEYTDDLNRLAIDTKNFQKIRDGEYQKATEKLNDIINKLDIKLGESQRRIDTWKDRIEKINNKIDNSYQNIVDDLSRNTSINDQIEIENKIFQISRKEIYLRIKDDAKGIFVKDSLTREEIKANAKSSIRSIVTEKLIENGIVITPSVENKLNNFVDSSYNQYESLFDNHKDGRAFNDGIKARDDYLVRLEKEEERHAELQIVKTQVLEETTDIVKALNNASEDINPENNLALSEEVNKVEAFLDNFNYSLLADEINEEDYADNEELKSTPAVAQPVSNNDQKYDEAPLSEPPNDNIPNEPPPQYGILENEGLFEEDEELKSEAQNIIPNPEIKEGYDAPPVNDPPNSDIPNEKSPVYEKPEDKSEKKEIPPIEKPLSFTARAMKELKDKKSSLQQKPPETLMKKDKTPEANIPENKIEKDKKISENKTQDKKDNKIDDENSKPEENEDNKRKFRK